MNKPVTGAEVRQSFIDFFVKKGHTFVPSSSLVPGGDATLLFTNAGMVQFKDVFLGTDHRPYRRAANSQKCMRVAGKHNDLDDVGRDDTHHTFFEMLGNWSFGDYYKKEAIAWAWELLTDIWGLDRSRLWTTCFKDDIGDIPPDMDAYENWVQQPGMISEHVLFFGRKDNFWEMADVGPCGPCSEIHIDQGYEACNKGDVVGHVCRVNGDCRRFLELWNLVFIQYNRLGPAELEALPAMHVDTGMGFERVVSILQGVRSNYSTDLLAPLMDIVQELTRHSVEQREQYITPYRVIADHARAAAFLIADGVVPGNTGRNYICRMIIRRAARFGSKIGLNEPFMASVARVVIQHYGEAYPELRRHQKAMLDSLTREEKRFQRTVEAGVSHLEELLDELRRRGGGVLDGTQAFDLYATHGLPLELTRDIAREQGLDVDESGFRQAMDEHRLVSGAGKALGVMGSEDVDVYRALLDQLVVEGKLSGSGVEYDPYQDLEVRTTILALVKGGQAIFEAGTGDRVEVVLPRSSFYVEAGGQVSDTGRIYASGDALSEPWEIEVLDVRKPAAGAIVHIGIVNMGTPRVGDSAVAAVDLLRRRDIMRNHTATHLLHAELHAVLGEHARQAGSLVAPDRLRFDFTHPEAVTSHELEQIEERVNQAIMDNYHLNITQKPLQEALAEGAMALFGEKYGETVRTITIGGAEPFSYELCGGTHVSETSDIGIFLITSEGSAAAGVRRIEAVTGHGAYRLVQKRFRQLKQIAALVGSSLDETPGRVESLQSELERAHKLAATMRQELATNEFMDQMEIIPVVEGVPVLSAQLPNADAETLRSMTDRFRQRCPSGVVVVGSVLDGRPTIIAAVTDDLVKRGLHAGELVKAVAQMIGGSGGGRPNLAQAGGKEPDKLPEALAKVPALVKEKLAAHR
ncbi:MAG TPA: alanine--tRNA ligase [Levilinea sp.]|nr:alanine--tRNA ligase [Levilinea sp.]